MARTYLGSTSDDAYDDMHPLEALDEAARMFQSDEQWCDWCGYECEHPQACMNNRETIPCPPPEGCE